MLEIKEEMSKVLVNIKLPSQIHHIIEEIYIEYQKSYQKLIQYLKIRYPNKEEEILKVEQYTLEDYNEDLQTVETIEFEEYEQRRAVVIETINNILKYMNENNDIKHTSNISEIVEERQDESFTRIVIYNAIEEIESSSKYLINRIKNLDLKEDKELKVVEQEFLQSLVEIKQKALQKSPEVNQIIREHFKSIYEKLINIIHIYEMQRKKENVNTIIRGIKNTDTER